MDFLLFFYIESRIEAARNGSWYQIRRLPMEDALDILFLNIQEPSQLFAKRN